MPTAELLRERHRLAHRRKQVQIAAGTYVPTMVPAGPVREHIEWLRSHNLSSAQIAKLSGVGGSTLSRILYGAPFRGVKPNVKVSRVIAEAVLAVRPTVDVLGSRARVDATGTKRRIQALMAEGWSIREIADRAGIDYSTASDVVNSAAEVSAAVHRAVRAAYQTLATLSPTCSPTTSLRARRRAERNGWPPSIAWDDDTIDDPNAQPAHLIEAEFIDEASVDIVAGYINKPLRPDERAQVERLTNDEKTAVIVKLRDAGHPFTAIGELIGLRSDATRLRYLRHIGQVAA